MTLGRCVLVAAAICVATAGSAAAATAADLRGESLALSVHCTPTDTALEELSGLAWSGDGGYAIADSGSDDRLAVLDSRCRVVRWIEIDFPTTDVEDLALAGDGTVWLADTGDNDVDRESIALIGVDPSTGRQERIPLTFADGAHDVEALLIAGTGTPVLVTKVKGEAATVYTTSGGESVHTMSADTPTVLVAAGTVPARGHDGEVRPITGAALSADGSTAALRTKKDVFLYRVRDADIVAALTAAPAVVLESPDQPQGEAAAFTDTGDLLLASEASGEPMPPIHEVARAVELARTADDPSSSFHVPMPLLVAGFVVSGVAAALWIRRHNRSGSAAGPPR
ncbi:hypothetical protein ACWDUM_04705 [Rhodococcus sp. NPDC003322]